MYVEGDKGTGRFITSLGVYLCWFIHHSHYWVVHITKSNEPPIIKQYHSHNTVQVIEPQKRVLVEREVCKDVRGCELLKGGECPDCVLEKIYE